MTDKKRISTVCPYCGVGCRFFITVQNERAKGIDYMTDHPVCHGKLCAKGNTVLDIIHHSERLAHPLKRVNGGFRRISWEEALDEVAQKLSTAREQHSADAISFLASAKCTNEENYLFQKLARMMGSPHVDHCARLCHSPTVVGLTRSLGNAAMTNPLSDLARSDCLLIVGANPAENHAPAMFWVWAAKDRGARIFVADPRLTPTAWAADEHLSLAPGSDAVLLNGMASIILAEGLYDRHFVASRTQGFEAFAESVKGYDPQTVSNITGVPVEPILTAARTYARAKTAAIVYCMGITQHTAGSGNVAAIANLALLTGQIGRKGAGVFPFRGQNNVQGACDMGALPHVLPGYAPVTDADARARFSGMWGVNGLPEEPGLTVVEMMRAANKGRVRAMWIMGEDPVNSDPNANEVKEALSSLDFLVVQDIFLTDTARQADIVLPAASWAEKCGTFTNTERRVQWFDPVVPPLHETRPDLWIIGQIGRRVGLSLGPESAEGVLAEINQTVPFYGGITRDRAAVVEGVFWPCPDKNHPGTPRLHEKRFGTPNGRGVFFPVSYRPPLEIATPEYPLVLTTGRVSLHYNAGSMTRRTGALMAYEPESRLDIHPDDAHRIQIESGQSVRVTTTRGSVRARARVTDTVDPGIVFLAFHFPDINTLTHDALDEMAKIPAYKTAACRVEKGGHHG